MRIAVMISNMGGPDSLDEVEPYLFNIFSDPDIIDIPLPRFLRIRFAGWLARKRGPKSRDIYKNIGGKTPLNRITNDQAAELQKRLNASGTSQLEVFAAMRYWHPLIEDVWKQIMHGSFEKIIVVTLYPFYSTTTTGSMQKLLTRLVQDSPIEEKNVIIIDRFGAHPGFIQAIAQQINDQLGSDKGQRFRNMLFSAHSIPMKRIRNGDPYSKEIEAFVSAIKELLPTGINIHLSYQSKIGPVEWLGPSTPDKISELAEKGIKNLLVYPLGFVADNSETTYEIDMLYRDLANKKGITNFQSMATLNTDPAFIDTLKQLVMQSLNESFN